MYADNQSKTYCLINTNAPTWQVLNALGHSLLGIGEKIAAANKSVNLLDYPGKNGVFHSKISQYPVVILQAKSAIQISKALKACIDDDIPYNVFCGEMFGASAEEQIAQTANATMETAEFIALTFFGDAEDLRPITKKYSTFKGFSEGKTESTE